MVDHVEIHQGSPMKTRVKAVLQRVLTRPNMARAALKADSLALRSSAKLYQASIHADDVLQRLTAQAAMMRTDSETINTYLRYYRHLKAHTAAMVQQPKISVIVPVYRPNPHFLRLTLNSVQYQLYDNWEVCITDDHSQDPVVTAVIEQFRLANPDRVKVVVHETNQHISAASNSALAVATGDYVALLDHDDVLLPNALAEMVKYINSSASHTGEAPEILYSDENSVGPDGQHLGEPFTKPGWMPILHLQVNYTTHLSCYRRDLLERIGGFQVGTEGAQDHDLMLRAVAAAHTPVVHVPVSLYQWRAHAQSSLGNPDAKPYAWENGRDVIRAECQRRGWDAEVTTNPKTNHYRISLALPAKPPLVSIVIPSKNAVSLLSGCLDSIFDRSSYPNYEVIVVDNGSTDAALPAVYQRYRDQHANFHVVNDNGYFNFARLIHSGVQASSGEYVLVLNNDTEVINSDWIEQMLMWAQLPEVGAVGAKLLYSDGTFQHAGISLDGYYVAHELGSTRAGDDLVYMAIMHTVHEAAAVTGACLMVSRADYDTVGAMDQLDVPNGYGDVDFCLKLIDLGRINLYTPYAELTHKGSQTRGRNFELSERVFMRQRWGHHLALDPYMSPHQYSGQYLLNPTGYMPDPEPRLLESWLQHGEVTAEPVRQTSVN